ncbi:MAG: cyclic nucleotide-binding domain-containing protein [Anaerolineae bacterium]|nr:cyclic nucleotide-binding domain-containing protein [Anaerolineae bacterium]
MAEELIEQLKKMDAFKGESQAELQRIADLVAELSKVGLFESLDSQQLAVIARAGKTVRYERGQVIIREGDTDKLFYVIVRGHVRVWIQPDGGPRQLRNYHEAGDFFGELIFFGENQKRAATVDVVEDVELVCFDEKGFSLIIEYPQITSFLRDWGQQRIIRSNRPFSGKHWDEISVVLAHKSWVALFQLILFPIAIIVLAWITMGLLGVYRGVSFEAMVSLLIAVTIGMGLWIFWMVEDWRNDEFIVTSKRLIHIERILVPPFPVERYEAPIDQVQDVTTRNHGLWTPLFGVRSLEIKTAGAGTIRFPYLDDAVEVSNQIFHSRDLARTRRNVEERTHIRQSLQKELDRGPISLLSPLESGEKPPISSEPRGILLKLIDYFVPHFRIVKRDQIIWRKHWLVLVKEVGAQFLLFCVSVVLLILVLTWVDVPDALRWYLLVPLAGGGVLSSFGWYLWCYDGWRNDIYIVTDSRIIDVEGSPFRLHKETRTEGTFDTIQNIDFKSPNWLARVLRIGRVTISTAAKKDAFTFDYVSRPEEVQQEIFKRLVAYRERRERAEAERQSTEFTKWFGIYRRITEEEE